MQNRIEIQNLKYRYPQSEKSALDGISFSIRRGEFVALIGPTGSGKSTLCYCINGAVPRLFGGDMRGIVKVNGLDTFENEIPTMAQHVGLVVQNARSQLFNVTVETEVAFGCENLGIPREDIRHRIERTLSFVGLEGFEKREPGALSGGQQQRVAIGCVLAMEPEVLVLDEPTSELDPLGSEQVMEVIARLNRELDKTIFLVTHNTEFVAQYADRVLVLKDGKLVEDGTPDEVFSQEALMRETRIRAPQVCELAYMLRQAGLPLEHIPTTLEEAASMFGELIHV